MTTAERKRLELSACKVRIGALRAIYGAQGGNLSRSLSSADLLVFLCDPQGLRKAGRNPFVFSSGYCVPGFYAALGSSLEDIPSLCLQICPENVEGLGAGLFTAPQGQGLSMAAGMALAARYQERDCRIYTLLNDEETAQAWDSFLLAAYHKLDNLCIIIEQSGPYPGGRAEDGFLAEKLRAMGFHVSEAEGHDFASLEQAFAGTHESADMPAVILVRTVMGKGVHFLENRTNGNVLDSREYERAMAELNVRLAELEAG